MTDFKRESAAFCSEVDTEAAKLIREGTTGPWEAITVAREIVLKRRQEKAWKRLDKTTSEAAGR